MAFRVAGVLAGRPISAWSAMVGYAVVVGLRPRCPGDRHDLDLLRGRDLTASESARQYLGFGRTGDPAVNPSYLFDVGCQLSFRRSALDLAGAAGVCPGWPCLRAGSKPVLGPYTPLDELERRSSPMAQSHAARGIFVIDGLYLAVWWRRSRSGLAVSSVSPIGSS